MKVEFLGTGGAITTPQPGCGCAVCDEARTKGRPYSRSGPSTFVHGPDVLIDTPEEIKDQLNRSQVKRIQAGVYSHWHPDHVMGRRVWEMNKDWRQWPPRHRCTRLLIPDPVAEDFKRHLGTWQHLEFLAQERLVEIVPIREGDPIDLGGFAMTPIRMAEEYVFAFLFEERGQRVLIIPDELFGWSPPKEVQGADLAVVPVGVMEFNPLTGERRIRKDHPVLKSEVTFEQTLQLVHQLRAHQVAFSHFEEPDGLSYDDHRALEEKLISGGLNVVMAYDGLVMDIA